MNSSIIVKPVILWEPQNTGTGLIIQENRSYRTYMSAVVPHIAERVRYGTIVYMRDAR